MALLWLMQATTDYESTCIDYCITYEVSPPSPQSRPAPLHHVKPDRSEQAFLMPAAIEIPVDALLAATAQVHNLVLVTRNTADVSGLGVRTLNPFDEAQA